MWSKDQTGSLLIMHWWVEITITPEVSGLPAFNDSLLKIHTWSAQTDTCSLCVSWQQRQERLCLGGGGEACCEGGLLKGFGSRDSTIPILSVSSLWGVFVSHQTAAGSKPLCSVDIRVVAPAVDIQTKHSLCLRSSRRSNLQPNAAA